jgi:Secretion system C-terminal sorting domain
MRNNSKAFLFLLFSGFLCFNAPAQNVMISNTANPNEPSIMMDPKNPNILVAGANLNNYYLSSDTGQTWTLHSLSSSYGVWGDPVIDVDTAGNFYFFHLSNPPGGNWIDRIVCQKSTDNGNSWNDGSYAGLNGTKAQDKEWSIVDRSNNNIYLTWTQFDDYGSSNPADSSVILFSRSTDEGNTWSPALRINNVAGDCIDSDNTVEGAVPAIGPNGEIYVAWAGPAGLVFNRSTDHGNTWLNQEIPIDPMPTGWDYAIPGINRANGLPITKCDLSGGPNHGTIYVNWSDQRNGSNDTDIWLSKSTDSGNTWTSPIRVNNDAPGKHQFFTWLDIDQTNGNLYFVFYDRRNYNDEQTDVFVAFSNDAGNTISNVRISESPFLPNSGVFFGDYTNIVAHNNIVRTIWTRLHNGALSMWTDITPFHQILSLKKESSISNIASIKQYPNPASSTSYVSFKLRGLSNVSLEIYDQQGRNILTLIDNQEMGYGKYIVPIDIKKNRLKNGVYYPRLSVNEKSNTLKLLVID